MNVIKAVFKFDMFKIILKISKNLINIVKPAVKVVNINLNRLLSRTYIDIYIIINTTHAF